MHKFVRRAALKSALAGAATLAAATLPRKLTAQTILTPKPDQIVRLRGMEGLVITDPPAPATEQGFTDADGKPVTIADFKGKGLVVNLWATWCVPCVAEMPALDALAEMLAKDDILVMPLSSDRGGALAVRKFYAAHNVGHLGIWLDPRGAAARAWGARGLPTTLIIDREGRERARLEGGAEWASDEAVAAIRRLTSGALQAPSGSPRPAG
jgi:thiol-disulfide isomerase/thioredoxin